jgi:hypothetical protein
MALARVEKIGHSYGVTESLGIAVLSRGHSYGVGGAHLGKGRKPPCRLSVN